MIVMIVPAVLPSSPARRRDRTPATWCGLVEGWHVRPDVCVYSLYRGVGNKGRQTTGVTLRVSETRQSVMYMRIKFP